ncbi:MAG: cobalamin-dependent protein [Chloroflexi bacterium]|nr:cobalamin-dependent protein [Chloroflexota bacterium]
MAIDVLLVNPVFLSQNKAEQALMNPYFPLGLLYLAAFIREKGFRVEIFDATFQEGANEFEDAISQFSPRVVGVSAVKPNREMALELANIAHASGALTILGGPDPTHKPELYVNSPDIDIVVHHEGELTLVALLQFLLTENSKQNLCDIDGIAFLDQNNNLVVTPRRSYILNLDDLPLPARDLIDLDKYLKIWKEHNGYSSLTISVARGCPYGCDWCRDSVHGTGYRQRSPESVAAEVKTLMEIYQIDRLRVIDDVDGIDQAWFASWAEAAKAEDAVIPFEALNDLQREDIPMLDTRDAL